MCTVYCMYAEIEGWELGRKECERDYYNTYMHILIGVNVHSCLTYHSL